MRPANCLDRQVQPINCDSLVELGAVPSPPLRDIAHAKTGTLRWANSLSDYVTTAVGERLVLSLMVNHSSETRPVRGDLDKAVVLLASFTGRTSE